MGMYVVIVHGRNYDICVEVRAEHKMGAILSAINNYFPEENLVGARVICKELQSKDGG